MKRSGHIADLFKTLSVDTRVRIVQLLKGRCLCVGALAGKLAVTQGAVSQHLRILKDAGLVLAEKKGYFVHYTLNPAKLRKVRSLVDGLIDEEQTSDRTGHTPPSTERNISCVERRHDVTSRKTSKANRKNALPNR